MKLSKVLAGFLKKELGLRYALKTAQDRKDMIVLDIGGEYSFPRKGTISDGTLHPVWHRAVFLSVNIDFRVCPVLLDNAVSLKHIADCSVDGIFSSHTIEHIPPKDIEFMLRTWYRVLKPGGRVEIRCPDIAWAWGKYLARRLPEKILPEVVLGISEGRYQVHKNVYWESKLSREMNEVGFSGIRRIHNDPEILGLDYWLYDGQFREFHGVRVQDLLIEGYKKDLNVKREI